MANDHESKTTLEEQVEPFYVRLKKAIDKGTGVRISAVEVKALSVTMIGEWAQTYGEKGFWKNVD